MILLNSQYIRTARTAVLVALLFSSTCVAQQIVYVDASLNTGSNDGSSWADAYQGRLGLQSALTNHSVGDTQFWVAAGLYAPAPTGGSRDAHFAMRNNATIFGGFAGGEISLDQRNVAVNTTILTGDLNNNDTPGQIYWNNQLDNATNVVRANNVNNTAVLDGVTVEHGAAAYVGAANDEGGNLRIVNGSPLIRNSTFRFGYAEWGGGGSATLGGSPHFEDCTWFKNIGSSFGAGAYNTAGGTSTFDRCNFDQNICGFGGGNLQSKRRRHSHRRRARLQLSRQHRNHQQRQRHRRARS